MPDCTQITLYSDWTDWGVPLVFWILLWGTVGGSFSVAQVRTSAVEGLTSEERPIRVALRPAYQRFEDGGPTITQWSAPLVAVVPFAERWQVSVRGSGASTGGENLQTLSGLSDVRAALSYSRPVGEGSVVVNASVNAPTGKEELTQGEFNTARLVSRNVYRFRVPSFGQGLGAGTGVTWAVPVSESVVLGLGGTFRYHGPYTPTAGQQEEYDPGEEGRVTGGIDVRVGPASAVSADVTLYLYSTDTVGGVERFKAGNQLSGRVRFLREGDEYTVRILAQYRSQEKSTLPLREGANRALQVLPTRGLLRGQYRVPLSEAVALQLSATGRWYDETTAYESQTLGTVGLTGYFSIGESLTLSPRAAYTAGSITGLEGGIGLSVEL